MCYDTFDTHSDRREFWCPKCKYIIARNEKDALVFLTATPVTGETSANPYQTSSKPGTRECIENGEGSNANAAEEPGRTGRSQTTLPRNEERTEWQPEVADFLTKADYQFVSIDEFSREVIAARICGPFAWTIGVPIQNCDAGLEEKLERQFKIGCQGVIVACPNFRAVQSVAAHLDQGLRSEWRERAAVTSIQALRFLFGNSS
jgi:hypothetical protein